MSSIWGRTKPHLWGIITGSDVSGSDVSRMTGRGHERKSPEPEVTEVCSAHARPFPAFFFLL